MKNLLPYLSANRWPVILAGFLLLSISANGVLVYVATRPDAPRPLDDYYRRSLRWDADQALLAASKDLGWSVEIKVPAGAQFTLLARRPVDVTVRDGDGKPVTGLQGRLFAMRPSGSAQSGFSPLVELPHAPGSYRTLARFTAPGLWELSLDTHQGQTPFVFKTRVSVDGVARP